MYRQKDPHGWEVVEKVTEREEERDGEQTEQTIKRGEVKENLWQEKGGKGGAERTTTKKKRDNVENRWENEKSRRAEENGGRMNGPHGLVQPPALRNGAGAEVPKLHLLKWSPAPQVNQSPQPHPQMSKKPGQK